ncbi:TIGR00269 family protein [Candidatus Woesearchaeota archaeon]|nr:TIGR00269 family protein [Candidatus Woesearchaeota archaeon]
MRCSRCGAKAVFSPPPSCARHLIAAVEREAARTIRERRLLRKGDRVAVAASGGKDSTACLAILHRLGHDVTAIAIDEGIKGYRGRTLEDLRRFTSENGIPLEVHSFEEEFGATLDSMLARTKENPCTACGILRRYLLNKHARRFDAIATGHNLDDEAQSVLMNLLRNQIGPLTRLGPATGTVADPKFARRIKPLYFIPERTVAAYAFLSRFGVRFSECPYASTAYRADVRDLLNRLEQRQPGTTRTVIDRFLELLPALRERYAPDGEVASCKVCGEPARGSRCSACALVERVVRIE